MRDYSRQDKKTKPQPRRPLSTPGPDEGPRERRAREQQGIAAEEHRERERLEREAGDRRERERSEQRLRDPWPPQSMAEDTLWGHQDLAKFLGLNVRRLRYLIAIGRIPIRRHSPRIISASKTEVAKALAAGGAGHAA
jgi:hypothetical protein